MNSILLSESVKQALLEDIGFGDRTSESIIDATHHSVGEWLAKQQGIIAGIPVVREVFKQVDAEVHFQPLIEDGEEVQPGQCFATVEGSTRSILMAERVALNYMQRMSGIATVTQQAVQEVRHYNCRIVDTRKTTPGLRVFEKYAVQVGGGYNHRMGLDDAVLIKDNHIAAAGSITEAVKRVRNQCGHMIQVEVEVESLEQVREAILTEADGLLLDNMPIDMLSQAVALIPQTMFTEASGNMQPGRLQEVAATGVNMISLGWLTHSARALDISLNVRGSTKNI